MADAKISGLPASITPLAGTEVLPVVQSGVTKQVSIANVTAGREVSASSFTPSSATIPTNGLFLPATNAVGIATNSTEKMRITATGVMYLGSLGTNLSFTNGSAVDITGSGTGIAGNGTNLTLGAWDGPMVFQAGNSGSALVERMRISSAGNVSIANGNLVIGTAGKGIDFSADGQAAGMTSELLDDYEEGTWTPVLTTNATDFTSVTYDAAVYGLYTKIGNVIHIQGMMRTDAVDATGATGLPIISGLPFTASAGTGFRDVPISISRVEGFVTNNPSSAAVFENTTQIYIQYRTTSNGAETYLPLAAIGTGADNNIMYFAGTYTAA